MIVNAPDYVTKNDQGNPDPIKRKVATLIRHLDAVSELIRELESIKGVTVDVVKTRKITANGFLTVFEIDVNRRYSA